MRSITLCVGYRASRLVICLIAVAVAAMVIVVAVAMGSTTSYPGQNGLLAIAPDRLYVVGVDGRGLREIADGDQPAWSPDGRHLAYSGHSGLVIQDLAGNQTVVGDGAGAEPSWSPDQRRLAIVLGDDCLEIWTINLDGSAPRRLTRRVSGIPCPQDEFGPAWSPDGRRIAFVASDGRRHSVWVMNAADGSHRRRLTPWMYLGRPSWSPDGKWIAYSGPMRHGYGSIGIIRADGSQKRVIRGRQKGAEFDPVWSPDGRWIAYVEPAAEKSAIYVMHPDGSHNKFVTGACCNIVGGVLDWQPLPRHAGG